MRTSIGMTLIPDLRSDESIAATADLLDTLKGEIPSPQPNRKATVMTDATDFPFGENAPAVAAEAPTQESTPAAEKEPTTKKAPVKKAVKSTKKASTKKLSTKKASTKSAAKKQPKKAAATKKSTKSESNGQRGRTSQFAGKKLYKVAKENPRREGTHGHNSFKLIKDGMTYEQFISKGGRLIDLAWDVEKGHVKVK